MKKKKVTKSKKKRTIAKKKTKSVSRPEKRAKPATASKKKASPKKRVSRATTGLDPQHYFYACNGAVLKNLDELTRFLARIDEDTFRHHVRDKDWNDFSNWIKEVIGDKTLARSIMNSRTSATMKRAVEKRLK